jgi:hypothetical protein
MDSPEHSDHHPIVYFVNGEKQQTTKHKLTVTEILDHAGFTPATEYQLERDSDHRKYTDYAHEVELHHDERFTSTFIGPTPTS